MAQLCPQTERHGEALDYLRRATEILAARGEPPDLTVATRCSEVGQLEQARENSNVDEQGRRIGVVLDPDGYERTGKAQG